MVQPKKPPVSLRIPQATQDRVKAWATERGIPRNAAYVEMIERGLKLARQKPIMTVEGRDTKLVEQIAETWKRPTLDLPLGPPKSDPGSRLKTKK